MKINVFKNRHYIALIPSINIYAGWWLVEIAWLNVGINIKFI